MDIVMKKSGYKGPVLLLKTICLRGRNKHGLRITETQKQWGTNQWGTSSCDQQGPSQ